MIIIYLISSGETVLNDNLRKQRKTAFIFDFVLFSLLAFGGELISQRALIHYHSPFSFSVAVLPLLILLFRWGGPAVPALPLFGLFSTLILPGAGSDALVINVPGYTCLALGMVLFLSPGRRVVRTSLHFPIFYVSLAFMGMTLSRSLILSYFEGNLVSALLLIISNETLSFVACSILFVLLRKRKGIAIYLPDLYREENANEGENHSI